MTVTSFPDFVFWVVTRSYVIITPRCDEQLVGFSASEDDGGLIISEYVLQVSDLIITNWRDISTFVSTAYTALVHTMTTT